ncbi:hypothetical protein STCU_10650 [Strigomonas culicis]|uniref:Uncharacterized protein n=1 Tax=Strigomonas culicis TaxID=28005 RepID=S9TKP3_9TRYP|nr:hypothetical protein STCU_10650 [Strigomonas culicis]|eukprot:EPY17389.1 hypothetical protein STCU_10650 [Strigomonas culicis]
MGLGLSHKSWFQKIRAEIDRIRDKIDRNVEERRRRETHLIKWRRGYDYSGSPPPEKSNSIDLIESWERICESFRKFKENRKTRKLRYRTGNNG